MAAGDGLVPITPTSIAFSGTSATINAKGGVNYSAITSLSLNGIFSASYDNYLIKIVAKNSAATPSTRVRMRASGSDDSGNNYTIQVWECDGSTRAASRTTGASSGAVGNSGVNNPCGIDFHIYTPFLARRTSVRSLSTLDLNGAFFSEYIWTHSQSTSYDGITIFPNSGNDTGIIYVFGYEE